MPLRYATVCSGIDAPALAWNPLGWQQVFSSEVERFPCEVLEHHHKSVPNLGDMTKIKGEGYAGTIDVLCGGTPCQDFSVAGKGAGMAGERGGLTLKFVELVNQIRPRWVVWENVPGVLSSNDGRDFGRFLHEMAQVGYFGAWRVLDAQYFRLAQRRKRVFAVFCSGNWQRAAAVLFEPESMSENPAPSREAGEGVAPTISARTKGGDGLGTDFDLDGGLVRGAIAWDEECNASRELAGPCHPISARAHVPAIAFDLRGREGGAMPEGPHPTANIRAASGGSSRSYVIHEEATPINTQLGLRGAETSNTPREGLGVGREGDPSFTLQANHCHTVQSGMVVRRLTPRECERLQGFPDDYTRIPRGKQPASKCADGPRYKALGNSMAVPCMTWIGKRIQMVHEND